MTEEEKAEFRLTGLPYQLSTLQAKLNKHASRELAQFDLKLVEWRVLFMLESLGESCLSELHRLGRIDKGQLSKTITRLLDKGYIEASVNCQDQRNRRLSLTRLGKEKAEPAHEAMKARRDAIADCLGSAGLEQMTRQIRVLHDFMSRELGEKE